MFFKNFQAIQLSILGSSFPLLSLALQTCQGTGPIDVAYQMPKISQHDCGLQPYHIV